MKDLFSNVLDGEEQSVNCYVGLNSDHSLDDGFLTSEQMSLLEEDGDGSSSMSWRRSRMVKDTQINNDQTE